MAIKLKSAREIELMRNAGRIVHKVLTGLAEMVAPGVTTAELDAEAERLTAELGAQALFKGVPGAGGPFPGTICTSLNEQVVHGIPSPRTVIRQGDVVSLDYGCRLAGYCGDAALTVLVGQAPPRTRELVDVTRRLLEIAVEQSRPGRLWSEVARQMQACAEEHGFSVIREFVGHGIGREMHEDPKVPNFVSRELLKQDILLQQGLVLAVEPMVAMGRADVKVGPDGWAVCTRDRQPAAHFEHTLAIAPGGCSVLTDGR